jgi:uncharacterized protein (TIGR03067 family)
MRRTIWLLAGVLLCLVALGSDSPKEYDDKVEANNFQGEWHEVSADRNGVDVPRGKWSLVFRNGKYEGVTDHETDSGTYLLSGRSAILRLHLVSASGRNTCSSGKFLTRVEGDTLKLAYYMGAGEWPTSFEEKKVVVSAFRRVK